MSIKVTYRKPPPKQTKPRRGKTYKVLEKVKSDTLGDHPALKDTEGWVCIATYKNGRSASNLKWSLTSGRQALPPGRWEFLVRSLPEGGSGVFARFHGETKKKGKA